MGKLPKERRRGNAQGHFDDQQGLTILVQQKLNKLEKIQH